MKTGRVFLVLFFFSPVLFLSFPAAAQIAIEKPWARATAPGAKVEMHVHINDNDVMKMRQVAGYDVPARGNFELKPGGAHLMFVDIRRPFKEGEMVPVKLKFEKAGEVSAEFHVGRLGASSPPSVEHKH